MKIEPTHFLLRQSRLFHLIAAVVLPAALAVPARAQTPAVDPAATEILERMTDYIGGLEEFSVQTQSTLEDLTDSGHRIDLDVSAQAVVRRPNGILSERIGDLMDQVFLYDGESLTLYNPIDGVYATVPAPPTISGTLDYVRDELGLIIPVSDLVYPDAYSLLMQDVTLAQVVGQAAIDGVLCDHLLFSRPGVDFQVWVADSGPPLPLKYVVTDTGTPGLLSLSTVMSGWQVNTPVSDSQFTFEAQPGDVPISFLPLLTTGN